MSWLKAVLLSGLVLVTLAGALWGIGGFDILDEAKVSPTNHQATTVEKLYVCPMHPAETDSVAGKKCGLCGMNLVLVDPSSTGNKTDSVGGCSHCGTH